MQPEHIAALTQMFLPHIMAQQNALGQTAIAGLKRSQAQKGLQDSRVSQTQELGLRGMQGNAASQQAFNQAFGLANQQAQTFFGAPAPQAQPNYNMANGFSQAVQQGLLAAALQGGRSGSKASYASGPSWTQPGWQPTPTWGLPASQEPPLYG